MGAKACRRDLLVACRPLNRASSSRAPESRPREALIVPEGFAARLVDDDASEEDLLAQRIDGNDRLDLGACRCRAEDLCLG